MKWIHNKERAEIVYSQSIDPWTDHQWLQLTTADQRPDSGYTNTCWGGMFVQMAAMSFVHVDCCCFIIYTIVACVTQKSWKPRAFRLEVLETKGILGIWEGIWSQTLTLHWGWDWYPGFYTMSTLTMMLTIMWVTQGLKPSKFFKTNKM